MKINGALDVYSHCGFAHDYQHRYFIGSGALPEQKQYSNLAEAEVHNTRGIAYSKNGEHDKAIAIFGKAIDLKSDSAHKPMPEFEEGARLKLALKAYENRELSTGLSARLAGMSREAFIYAMGKHGLSPFGTIEEIRELGF